MRVKHKRHGWPTVLTGVYVWQIAQLQTVLTGWPYAALEGLLEDCSDSVEKALNQAMNVAVRLTITVISCL